MELLADLTAALASGSRTEVLALAAPGVPDARRSLGQIYDNARELRITSLTMRLAGVDVVPPSAEDRRTFGGAAWVADVVLAWRLAGYDSATSRMQVALTLVDTTKGVAFGSVRGHYGNAVPLWLLEELAVERDGRALVVVADEEQLDRYARLAGRALRDVRAVLPAWRRRLVVEVPATEEQLHRVLGVEPGSYDSIAAVTATVDGSRLAGSPVHILVNPAVLDRLGEQGAQIVMSHEATHVAVDAARSTMPLWLLEGFADYVALARTDLPVSVTATQILAQVRRGGAPANLPGSDDFDPANKLLGTSYEAAWLACRLLAESYGERRLVRFYRTVDRGAPVADAFADLGTTRRSFTRQWRGYLRRLAG